MIEAAKRTVLLVEDDQSLAEIYAARLRQGGFACDIVRDGAEVLESAHRNRPDIILLDLVLPKQSGFGVLRELKDDPTFRAIPVIILSNLGDARDIEQGETLGAAGHIVKSQVTPADILEEIQHVIAKGREPLVEGSIPRETMASKDNETTTDQLLGDEGAQQPEPTTN